MATPLWRPSDRAIEQSNLSRFCRQLKDQLGVEWSDYDALHQWSVDNSESFWREVWSFTDIRYSRLFDAVLEDGKKFPGAKWFPGARLNFAENLLRNRSKAIAIVSRLENGQRQEISYSNLYQQGN